MCLIALIRVNDCLTVIHFKMRTMEHKLDRIEQLMESLVQRAGRFGH